MTLNFKVFEVDEDEVPSNIANLIAVPFVDCGFCYFSLMQCPLDNYDNTKCIKENRKDQQDVMFVKRKKSVDN